MVGAPIQPRRDYEFKLMRTAEAVQAIGVDNCIQSEFPARELVPLARLDLNCPPRFNSLELSRRRDNSDRHCARGLLCPGVILDLKRPDVRIASDG